MAKGIIPLIRTCTKCHNTYPNTAEFFAYNKGYLCSPCKQCRRKENAAWRKKNEAKHKADKARWQRENPEKVRAAGKRYRKRHTDRARAQSRHWYQNNRIAHAQTVRIWHENNRPKVRATKLKRRAFEKGAVGVITASQIECLYQEQNSRCAYCGITLHGEYHIDHAIPLSRSGANSVENILIACGYCNRSKGDKMLTEWEQVRGW